MSSEGTISVYCECGKKLKAPATAVGRKARCPACGSTVVLTASAPTPVSIGVQATPVRKAAVAQPIAVAAPADDDSLGAMYALAEQEQAAPPAKELPHCPQCQSEMDEDAVLCTECGYDTRTGKALSTSSVSQPAKTGGWRRSAELRQQGSEAVLG